MKSFLGNMNIKNYLLSLVIFSLVNSILYYFLIGDSNLLETFLVFCIQLPLIVSIVVALIVFIAAKENFRTKLITYSLKILNIIYILFAIGLAIVFLFELIPQI